MPKKDPSEPKDAAKKSPAIAAPVPPVSAAAAKPTATPTTPTPAAAATEAARPESGGEAGADAPRPRRKNAPMLLSRKARQPKPKGRPAAAAPAEGAAAAAEPGDDEAAEGAEGAEGAEAEEGAGDPAALAALDAEALASDGPDVAELTEAEIPEVEKSASAVSDFLATYFKDLTKLPLLGPASEYELARRIGIMEEVLWVQVLSFAPITAHLIGLIEGDVGKPVPEFRALHGAARDVVAQQKTASKELSQAAGPASTKLRQIDLDRIFVTAALEEIKTIDAAVKDGQGTTALAVTVPPQIWQNYVQGISVISQLIQRAKDEFVQSNLRLVVSIARRFNYGRMPLADLIQEGNMGLLKAVERFDYRRGFRFSTYASWWIRHAIARALAEKGRVVRLPVHALADIQSILKVKRRMTRELNRAPTPEELAEATGQRVEKIRQMDTHLIEDAVSLDREVTDENRRSFMDLLEDESATQSMSERLISEAMLSEVQRLLTQLTPLEADILRLRFGLETDEELTLREIGVKHKLSRERIRQLQEQALNRMRKALARKDLI